MPAAFVASPLTEHLSFTPEKYSLCRSVPVARSGWMKYRGEEIGLVGDDSIYNVYRSPTEVFAKKAVASGEGKSVVSPHPPAMLDASNTQWHGRGHMQNLRRGDRDKNGDEVLLADLILTDPQLIAEVLAGRLRECSLGYSCRYVQTGEREFMQSDIMVNHCAIVASARAGHTVAIQDAKESVMTKEGKALVEKIRAIERSVDEESLAASMVRSSERVNELTRSGVGAGTFHQELAAANPAYKSFDEAQRIGQEYSDAMKRAGEQMGMRYKPCRDSAVPLRPHR